MRLCRAWPISPQFNVDHTLFGSGDTNSNLVYRSTNGGATWLSATIGVSTTTIDHLSLSPAFASDHIAYAIGSDGLYRSANGGDTWASISDFDQQWITSLVYAPDWPTHPYALISTAQGLYRSIDGGITWSLIPELAHVSIRPIVFSPDWPTHLDILIGTSQSVYRSIDGGATWARTSGFEALSASLLILASDGAMWLTETSNGLYATADQGHSWSPIGRPREYIYTLAASPAYTTDHTVFVKGSYTGMGVNLLRTTDNGATWQNVRSVSYNGGLAFSPQYATDHTLYLADSGVSRSTDGGDTWDPIGTWPPLATSFHAHIALLPNYPDDPTLFVAGPGFWRLPPSETVWQPAASGLLSTTDVSAMAVAPNYSTSHTVLVVTFDDSGPEWSASVLRSDDGGVNWQPSEVGVSDGGLRSIAFSPHYADDHTVYLVSTTQLYRSIDDGHSWTAIGAPPDWPDLNAVAVNQSGQVIVASSAGVWRYSTGFRDILIDGDFEAGSGWELIGKAGAARTVIFNGQQALRLGLDNDSNVAIDSAAIQTVTIPLSATIAQLNFRVYPVSSETQMVTPTQPALNRRRAIRHDSLCRTRRAMSRTLFAMLSNAQQWQRYSFDLTPYAGKTLTLRFGVINDGEGGQTALYVDNASLITLGSTGTRVYLPVILKTSSE